MKVKVLSIKKDILQEDNSNFLDVEFELVQGSKRVMKRRLAFNFGTTKDEIKKELKKYATNIEDEMNMKKKNEKREVQEKQADEVIEGLQGQTI